MTTAVGYIGATLVGVSYLFPVRRMLVVQWCACWVLAAYSLVIGSWPYLALQLFCLGLITIRLVKP
ncbi:MAG: hypothetical protein ACM3W4_01110 [Ignavibacteriales bacterium]